MNHSPENKLLIIFRHTANRFMYAYYMMLVIKKNDAAPCRIVIGQYTTIRNVLR
jgi:hypothetical protein